MKTRVFTFLFKNKAVIIMNILGFYLLANMAENVIAGIGLGVFWVTLVALINRFKNEVA